LHQGVADNEDFLVAARQDRYERDMTQHLRQQQDEAYLQSFKADQEKEKRKKEILNGSKRKLHLYQFVFSHAEAPNNFDIATNFPKRSLPCKTTSKGNPTPPTFMDVGLRKNEMLFVYDLES
ncbi:FAS-associated factor 2-like, partial [Folsomia candida]|uniref:FAS-associated factor 2-like n=1 Tax=Folsomia candida TaxID=158441 RepID=UPI001604D3B1